jgi:hypothetical protein
MASPSNPCGLFSAPGAPDRHIYCGPTALAAITGIAPGDVEKVVLAYRAKHGTPRRNVLRGAVVRMMWSSEIAPVAELLGWRATELLSWPRPSFAQWSRLGRGDDAYLVLVTHHFVAVRGQWFADSAQRNPIPLRQAKHKRKRVQRYWKLEPITKAEA